MGRIHTLYYIQVKRSQEDAKKERMEERRKRVEEKNGVKKRSKTSGPSNGNILENRRAYQQLEELLEESQ